jgi:glutamate-1-semialdehyde 2,1-aminomutase
MGRVNTPTTLLAGAMALALALAGIAAYPRLLLSRAKHRSLAGHARWSRRLARLVPYYEYDEVRWFRVDGAPDDVAATRRVAFARLAELYRLRFARSAALTAEASEGLSDLQFTNRYRVPFPFSRRVRESLRGGNFVVSSSGSTLTDLDGNVFLDLTGSYGVNVFGNDFYKECMAAGMAATEALGPVLGALHPCVADNVAQLRAISQLDEVSFHMSGTEAVMQAVRLARYHTRRRHLVRFCGAYHGWWGDVQPGVGNPQLAHDTFTLQDMSPRSLKVLATRNDIACVLVNPLQALHPNRGAPVDSSLIDGTRRAHFDREAYARWLGELRRVCSERGIVLIFDEVFMGFRLAPGGAQEYFGVRADLVTYGKTVAGGLPAGVLCGRRELMRRYHPEWPADICFARGTFNAHPTVMAAMNEFLRRLATPAVQALYAGLEPLWNARVAALNTQLEQAGLPLRVASLGTVWSVYYTEPGRYHWMLQYYLRAHGLALSWVGTGRLIFTLTFSAADYAEFTRRLLAAAREMQADGWWWRPAGLTAGAIRRGMTWELLQARCSWSIGSINSPRNR